VRCSSPGSVLRVGEAVAEAPGLGAGVDDVRAVGEAVNDGFGEPGVGEHLGPFTERQVCRDDQRRAFVAFGMDLEDELGSPVGAGADAELCETEQVGRASRSAEAAPCGSPRSGVSKSDGSQTLAPQRDALLASGVAPERIYQALASGRHDARLGLLAGAAGPSRPGSGRWACDDGVRDSDCRCSSRLPTMGRRFERHERSSLGSTDRRTCQEGA
jgi:hypothetical protein